MFRLADDLDEIAVQITNIRSLMLSKVPSFKEFLSKVRIVSGAYLKTSSYFLEYTSGSKDA